MGDHFKTDIDQLAAFTKDLKGANDSLEQVRTALQHVLQKNTDNYREVETSLEESFKRAAAAGK
ncbi:hypothetical protein [Streptomyces sp. NPDC056479]|uniref:hypothetical protein n=1 Tax=unclassified Streptomyces TaxID=2593676 RepID=UPI0036757601